MKDSTRTIRLPSATRTKKTIAGSLAGGLVPTLDDFRAVRRELGDSIAKRTRAGAKPRR